MSANDSTVQERTVTAESIEVDKRDVRALTECMSVLSDVDEARGTPDLYRVVGQNGGTYTVDVRHGRCSCPDAEYRDPDGGCKHVRRVRYATGETAIPSWVDPDAVDGQIGIHVDESPIVAAADGGTVNVERSQSVEEDGDDGDDDGRPDGCDCAPFLADEGLPCWPCHREGFETPNPAVDDGGDGE